MKKKKKKYREGGVELRQDAPTSTNFDNAKPKQVVR